jgi:hypothetical protein
MHNLRTDPPLVSLLQPTPWSRYQQLVKEWQEGEATRRAACQREGRAFVATKKPPLDAFSLRPTSYSKEQRRLQRKTGNSPGRPKNSLKRGEWVLGCAPGIAIGVGLRGWKEVVSRRIRVEKLDAGEGRKARDVVFGVGCVADCSGFRKGSLRPFWMPRATASDSKSKVGR